MEIVGILALAAVLAVVPGHLAQRKGHSFWTWWLFGVILWIVAVIAVFFVKDKRPRCPECAEVVRPEATRCPHCQSEIAGRMVQYVTPTA